MKSNAKTKHKEGRSCPTDHANAGIRLMQPNVAGTPATVRFVSPDASWAIDAITPPQHPFPWRHCGRSFPFANPRSFDRGFFRFRETSTPAPGYADPPSIADFGLVIADFAEGSGIRIQGLGKEA